VVLYCDEKHRHHPLLLWLPMLLVVMVVMGPARRRRRRRTAATSAPTAAKRVVIQSLGMAHDKARTDLKQSEWQRVEGKMNAVIMIWIERIPDRRESVDSSNRCTRSGVDKLVVLVVVLVVDRICRIIMTAGTTFFPAAAAVVVTDTGVRKSHNTVQIVYGGVRAQSL
jgi:hypothetical protein